MVFSAAFLAAAARAPAEHCQPPSRPGRRRLRADEVLRALFRPPAQELGRLADFLYVFFCLPLPEYYYMSGSGRGGAWATRRAPSRALYGHSRWLSSVSSSSSSSSSSSMSLSEYELYYSED